MMLRKTTALLLIAGLALMGAPLSAQTYAPNTVWGEVPAGSSSAAFAVLLDVSGNAVATVPVVDGKFVFGNVDPGQYVVMLTDAASADLARSHAAQMGADGVVKALFGETPVAVPIVATSGGGIGTTGWVLIGAGAVGIVTAIVLASDDDEGVASPIR
jgi:hypothetical protein